MSRRNRYSQKPIDTHALPEDQVEKPSNLAEAQRRHEEASEATFQEIEADLDDPILDAYHGDAVVRPAFRDLTKAPPVWLIKARDRISELAASLKGQNLGYGIARGLGAIFGIIGISFVILIGYFKYEGYETWLPMTQKEAASVFSLQNGFSFVLPSNVTLVASSADGQMDGIHCSTTPDGGFTTVLNAYKGKLDDQQPMPAQVISLYCSKL